MISVVTPVWNRSDLTHQFLFQNSRLYGDNPEVEFVVIDNGSTDNTQEYLDLWQRKMPNLKVLTSKDNTGFGPAHNWGSREARGDVLIELSNDVVISGDYIALVREAVEANPDAMFGPQVMTDNTGWNVFGGKVISYIYGWCIFCSRKVWEDVGGFDERFVPCDYEDIDISMRAVEKGHELRQVDLPLRHLSGQSAQNLSGGRLAITLKNQALFKEKWGFA